MDSEAESMTTEEANRVQLDARGSFVDVLGCGGKRGCINDDKGSKSSPARCSGVYDTRGAITSRFNSRSAI